MSRVAAMLADRPAQLRPPAQPPPPPPPPPRGPLVRWARQDVRPGLWQPWWVFGLVQVVTYPHPRLRGALALYVPGIPASVGFPARRALFIEVPV